MIRRLPFKFPKPLSIQNDNPDSTIVSSKTDSIPRKKSLPSKSILFDQKKKSTPNVTPKNH